MSPELCAVIVDDNEDAAATLAALLATMDCEAMFITDPRRALSAVASRRPKLVFLDIGMPHLDGHELARLIRLEHPGNELLIIGISGYADHAEHRERARLSGFDELMTKPPDLARIHALVDRVMR